MVRFPRFAAALLLSAALFGCTGESGGPSGASTDSATSSRPDPKVEAALAELSPADRALAEKQKICPVSGEPLGSMGPPIKMTIDGRDILICCAGCEDAVKEDPEKYFAKIEQAGGKAPQ